MRDQDTAAARIIALERKYARTDIVNYDHQLHVRQGRRVVCVYDLLDDTLRINELRSEADANRVNEVLAILEATARIEALAAPKSVGGIKVNPTFVLSADPAAKFSIIEPIETRVPYKLTELGAEESPNA